MKQHVNNEKGIALVLAIISLFMIGALITAIFTPSMLDQRMAESTRRGEQAFSAAEYGLNETISGWDPVVWNAMANLDSTLVSGTLQNGVGTYEGAIHRMNNEIFFVDMTGRDEHSSARQRLGQFVRLQLLDIDIQAALTTKGPTKIGGSAELHGNDAAPSGWPACPPLDSGMAGLRLPDIDDLTTVGGCSGASCIDGNPAVDADTTLGDSTFFEYGGLDWDGLKAMATVVIGSGTHKIKPSLLGSACNTADMRNWGDPQSVSSPCFGHFPIIYAPGDLRINGNLGQGILMVEGDLSVQGGFEFYGITLVKGKLKTAGTGGHFNGAVLAANVDLDDVTILGNALVQYSSCSVRRALQAASSAAPLRSRSWLYAY